MGFYSNFLLLGYLDVSKSLNVYLWVFVEVIKFVVIWSGLYW